MPLHRPLRSYQAQVAGLVLAIAAGKLDGVRDILAALTPGAGKSLLPVIAAATLIAAAMVDRVVWVLPRDSLRLQAEEAFTAPGWRATLGHALTVRAADNEPDPSRGLAGYVTTYQGIAAATELHPAEMRRHRTLLVVDEMHHLPSLADYEPGPACDMTIPDEAWSWIRALLPMLECASVRLLLSGTLERADGRAVLWLAYRRGPRPGTRQVDMEAPGWAVVGYSRAQAVADRAVLPVTFGSLDGEATWAEPLSSGAGEEERVKVGPHRLSGSHPTETTRPALFTALRTGFADLVGARRPEALAAFRLLPEPSILMTVAMAYEGLDAPEVAVVAALTHVRSRPRLEQMIARATRVDPNAGPYEGPQALVFHPDEPLFANFRRRIETEQGTLAKKPKAARQGTLLPSWLLDQTAERGSCEEGIVPLESNALGLRYATLKPGPTYAHVRPENEELQTELLDPPSMMERRLRLRIGEMVAAQAVEDDAGFSVQRGQGRYHGYTVLKRATGAKNRSEMTPAELEAAGSWLERNRVSEHLHLFDGDMRYAWSARQRSRMSAGMR